MKRLAVCLVLTFGVVACANGESLSYNDFSDTSALTLNGCAETVGSRLRLARLPVRFDNNWGTCFTNTKLDVTSFHTHFQFQITDAGGLGDWDSSGVPGGDGFVFCVQPIRPDIIGYSDALGGYFGYAGIVPSMGVEFDTFKHQFDPDSNHLGIDLDGNVYHQAGMPTLFVPTRFDDGNVWDAWVDYDGHTLEVRANQTGVYPNAPLLSYAVDIPADLGTNTAYLGFCGATGAAVGNYDILRWQYTTVPEPSSFVLLVAAIVGIGGYAWRRLSSTP